MTHPLDHAVNLTRPDEEVVAVGLSRMFRAVRVRGALRVQQLMTAKGPGRVTAEDWKPLAMCTEMRDVVTVQVLPKERRIHYDGALLAAQTAFLQAAAEQQARHKARMDALKYGTWRT